jgi:uncharacterized protein (TIGR03086 family)
MDTAARYRTNAQGFTARVAHVSPAAWSSPSPCEGWSARDVVRHVVDSSRMFLGFIGRDLPPAASVDDDPLAAWTSARDEIQAALDDPATAKKEYDGFAGRATFEQGVGRFLAPDLVVHTWDLARAADLDDALDVDAVEDTLQQWEPMDQMMRAPQAFGDKIDPPQHDDPQTRLLNFAGRRV